MKACNLLLRVFIDDYDAAAKRAYEKTVTRLRSTMTEEFAELPRSPEGQEDSVRIVGNILMRAEVKVQGWTVTESLRNSYLQPLRDHGDMETVRLVSLESC